MAFRQNGIFYVDGGDGSTTGYWATALRPQNTNVTAGQLVRQATAPTFSAERVFICIVAGKTANTADATWTTTRGAKTTDGTATWQDVTGWPATNGDISNTVDWTTVKSTAIDLGQIIKRNNGASYWICSTAGTAGSSEPSWPDDNAGSTRTDNTVTWTCLGAVGNFTAWLCPFPRMCGTAGVMGTSIWANSGSNNKVLVAHSHTETSGSARTLLGNSTLQVWSVDKSAALPLDQSDKLAGAMVSCTGNGVNLSVNANGGYYYGLTCTAGDGSNTGNIAFNQSNVIGVYDTCKFQLTSDGGTADIDIGTASSAFGIVIWINCQCKFGSTGQNIDGVNGVLIWRDSTQAPIDSGGSMPSQLVTSTALNAFRFELFNLDLSAYTGATILNSQNTGGDWCITNCKLSGSTDPLPSGGGSANEDMRRYSTRAFTSANSPYDMKTRHTLVNVANDLTHLRGASPWSLGCTFTTIQFWEAIRINPIVFWNDQTTAITVTAYFRVNKASVQNDDEVWIEAHYLSASDSTLGAMASSSSISNPWQTGVANTADSVSSWAGGLSPASNFKCSVTFTPGRAGPVMIQPRFATIGGAASSRTVYLDPLLDVTNMRPLRAWPIMNGLIALELQHIKNPTVLLGV